MDPQQDNQVLKTQPQPVILSGSSHKEVDPTGLKAIEVASISETSEVEIPPEIQEYIQKTERDMEEDHLPVIQHVGAEPKLANLPQIVLPLTKPVLASGLKATVTSSLRWLATWCLRLIKKFRGRIVYSSETVTRD